MPTNLAVDAALRRLQSAQLGLFAWSQARAAGLSHKALRHRVRTGRVVRRHRGVYADPATPRTWEQDVLAAVLASGPTAFASHATAARMWELPAGAPDDGLVEVTTVLERDPKLPGVRSHRSGLLLERDVRTRRGIPVASPERTCVDLSGRCSVAVLGRIIDEALRRRITTLGLIHECLERLPRAPGRSPESLRAALASRVGEWEPRESLLEDFVIEALRRHGLPLPRCQVRVQLPSGPRRLDHCYPRERVVIEADGYDTHSSRAAFDDDRARGNELVVAGYRVLHFTSEFTDREIAQTVANALGGFALRTPPQGPQSFKQWIGVRRAARSSARASGARTGR
jgi:very-short-patch-repair endonuclease